MKLARTLGVAATAVLLLASCGGDGAGAPADDVTTEATDTTEATEATEPADTEATDTPVSDTFASDTDTFESDSGYSDSGYSDSGYSDSGYSDSGYSDSGYSDSGYSDTADTTVVRSTLPTPAEFLESGPKAARLLAAAQAADQEPDTCPYGPTSELVAALPESLPLVPSLRSSPDDDGQAFWGGDVDILYCPMRASDYAEGPIDEVRVDVAPQGDVPIATYLDEEYVSDPDISDEGVFVDGTVGTACWDDSSQTCLAWWQGPDLFISVVLIGEADVEPDQALAALKALVPLVRTKLAALPI